MEKSAEQKARDMLERMGIKDAQNMTSGDVVELANLIAKYDAKNLILKNCPVCNHARCDDCTQELVKQTTWDGSGYEYVPGLLNCCQCEKRMRNPEFIRSKPLIQSAPPVICKAHKVEDCEECQRKA